MKKVHIKVGDWVRFYQRDKVVIARVEYLPVGVQYAETELGRVRMEDVFEVRS